MSHSLRADLRICLVCTGNTCRSPISEGILKQLAALAGFKHWHVDSGGLSAYEGAPASQGSVLAAREHGIELGDHKASLFDLERALACDLILVHSGEHYHRILTWNDALEQKTFLLKYFPHTGDPGPEAWIADPIGMELDAYRKTYRELEAHLGRIVPEIEVWAEKGRQGV